MYFLYWVYVFSILGIYVFSILVICIFYTGYIYTYFLYWVYINWVCYTGYELIYMWCESYIKFIMSQCLKDISCHFPVTEKGKHLHNKPFHKFTCI